MRHRFVKVALWSVGSGLLLLTLWLAFYLLSSTTLEVDVGGRKASAEAGVGTLACRKTLSGTPPFFTLTCRDKR